VAALAPAAPPVPLAAALVAADVDVTIVAAPVSVVEPVPVPPAGGVELPEQPQAAIHEMVNSIEQR